MAGPSVNPGEDGPGKERNTTMEFPCPDPSDPDDDKKAEAKLLRILEISAEDRSWRQEDKVFNTGDSLIPGPLEDGRYRIRMFGPDRRDKSMRSQAVPVEVDPPRAFPKRIKCRAPFVSLFVGPTRANPCCNLKAHSGLPYYSWSTVDPWNSPGMVLLREALLRGDSTYCHEGCTSVRSGNEDRADLFWSEVGDAENRRAYLRGELVLDHPVSLKIGLGSACNHACGFCKQNRPGGNRRRASSTAFWSSTSADSTSLR